MNESIDLVLILGAGASRDFGGGGRPLPLMADFSAAIRDALQQKHPAYLQATNLSGQLDGQEFERRLGTFLRAVLALDRIESVLPATCALAGLPALTTEMLDNWYQSTKFHLQQVVDTIHTVVYQLCGIDGVDVPLAGEAYRALFAALDIDNTQRVVIATTNYDEVPEYALEQIGLRTDSGEPRHVRGEPLVQVDCLLEGGTRNIPVLHLHGRLGWYRRPGSTAVYFAQTQGHSAQYGVPVMVLPDPEKSYDEDPVITSLWEQFSDALRRTRRVLIIGHSLNDDGLLLALQRNVEPLERVAVVTVPPEGEEESQSASSLQQAVERSLPKATTIPLRFTSPLQTDNLVSSEWQRNSRTFSARPGTRQ